MSQSTLPSELIFSRIAAGGGYIVPKMQDISAGGSVNIHIRNPHADKVMWLAGISIFAEGNVDFLLHDSFDSITDGVEIIIQNALMDSEGGAPDSGPFEAFYGSTFTEAADSTIPVGFTVDSGPATSQSVDIFPVAVEPGREVVIELDNQDSSVNKSLISLLLLTSY